MDRPSDAEIPPIPEPFTPIGPELPAPGPSGCGLPMLVGCGVLTLVALVMAVVVTVNAPRLVAWAFEQSRIVVFDALPEDMPAEERRELERVWAETVRGMQEQRIPAERWAEIQSAIQRAVEQARDDKLTREDAARLTADLQAVLESAKPSVNASRGSPRERRGGSRG